MKHKKIVQNTNRTILSAFLDLLHVNHTQSFANKLYNEHPYKYSLYGLSKMLSDYNIENAGVSINNKKDGICELEVPFIAHTGDDFVLVFKKNENKVSYIWQNKPFEASKERFLEIWSGVVLLAEPNEYSTEPNYKKNKHKEWVSQIQQSLLILLLGSILLFTYVTQELFTNFGVSILMLLNLMGVYVCLLLILKQMHVKSNYADKLCSLFKKSDCNDILESKDAKLWGVIGWSEIGLGYFTSNLLIVLWFPQLISYLSLVGYFTLIFSFWSIWYQKVKVGQWCPLCLIVQFLFWLLFLVNLFFGFMSVPSFAFNQVFIVACLYTVPVLCINMLYPKLETERKVQKVIQEMNSIKMRDEVIAALLSKQPFHAVYDSDSQIIFGNPSANIRITILTNPHCEPCGMMHRRVEKLLSKVSEKISVQYIFSSFNAELEISNKHLIAIYLNSSIEQRREAFYDWFEKGKYQKEDFFRRYPQNTENNSVKVEFENHNAWKIAAGLAATPTILVNGYILPREYRLEDILYFTEIDVNSIAIAKS